jgi:hypothetical protein
VQSAGGEGLAHGCVTSSVTPGITDPEN